jgi:hypothetical protein
MEINNTNYKICSHCKENKPTTEFHYNKRSIDKLQLQCKFCQKEIHSEYYRQNKEKIKQKTKEWRTT